MHWRPTIHRGRRNAKNGMSAKCTEASNGDLIFKKICVPAGNGTRTVHTQASPSTEENKKKKEGKVYEYVNKTRVYNMCQ
jgi:hypothetical protein